MNFTLTFRKTLMTHEGCIHRLVYSMLHHIFVSTVMQI